MENPLDKAIPEALKQPDQHTRRKFLFKVALLVNGAVGAVLAVPVLGYVLGPVFRKQNGENFWVPAGNLQQFPPGQTRLAKFRNPNGTPADGETRNLPCWVRNIDGKRFQVFAINCAHMDCPVHWFPQSKLFLCPCHGGVYYQDGSVAAGPPPRGLYEYRYKIVDDQLMIWAGELPTLSTEARLRRPENSTCLG